MIITRKYAKRLVSQGKAKIDGYMCDNRSASIYFAILIRYDIGRTDHYYVPSKSKEYRSWE